jgi:hypothetical protein
MAVSVTAIYSAMAELQGVSQYQELLDLELVKMAGWLAAEMTPHLWSAPLDVKARHAAFTVYEPSLVGRHMNVTSGA